MYRCLCIMTALLKNKNVLPILRNIQNSTRTGQFRCGKNVCVAGDSRAGVLPFGIAGLYLRRNEKFLLPDSVEPLESSPKILNVFQTMMEGLREKAGTGQ